MALPTVFNINKILAIPGPAGAKGDAGATGASGARTYVATASLTKGDVVCNDTTVSGATNIVRATAANVAAAKSILGVVEADVTGGASTTVAGPGRTVAANVFSDLGVGTNADLQLNSVGRCARQTKFYGGIKVGSVDTLGNVTIDISVPQAGPTPKRKLNVRDFGAIGDGLTDDLDAFDTCLASCSGVGSSVGEEIEIPPGTYYIRDTWHVDRSVQVHGNGGGTGRGRCLIFVAPGKTAVQMDSLYTTRGTGGGADDATVEYLDLQSHAMSNRFAAKGLWENRLDNHTYLPGQCAILYPRLSVSAITNTSGGSAVGATTLDITFTAAHGMSAGDIFKITGVLPACANDALTVASVQSSTKVRVNVNVAGDFAYAGGGLGFKNAGVFVRANYKFKTQTGSNDPAAFATMIPGDVINDVADGPVTLTAAWTCEAFPISRGSLAGIAARVGDRDVLNGCTGTNVEDAYHVYAECTIAGTRANTTVAPGALVHGQIGTTYVDGTATFVLKTHSGIACFAPYTKIAHIHPREFTNCGVFLEGIATGAPNGSSVDSASVSNVVDLAGLLGCGLYIGGSDGNAVNIHMTNFQNMGKWFPGKGGHSIYDHGASGASAKSCYSQGDNYTQFNGTGRGIYSDSSVPSYDGCFSENSGGEWNSDEMTGSGVKTGGHSGSNIIIGNAVHVVGGRTQTGRCFREIDEYGTYAGNGRATLYVGTTKWDSQTLFYWITSLDGGTAIQWALQYDTANGNATFDTGTGWAGYTCGAATIVSNVALGFSHSQSVEGPGHWRDYKGHFIGLKNDTAVLWRGLYNRGLTDKKIRGGHFLAGDTVEIPTKVTGGTWRKYLVLTAGYRGDATVLGNNGHWQATTTYVAANTSTGQFADTVEPTTNTYPLTVAGQYAFKVQSVTGDAKSGTVEPTWDTTIGNTTVDNHVTWVCTGVCPTYGRLEKVDDGVTAITPEAYCAWQDSADTDTTTAAPEAKVLPYRARKKITTNTANQTLFIIPALPNNCTATIDIEIVAKRNGNHGSHYSQKMTLFRGKNNAGSLTDGADIIQTPITWGAENSLAAVTCDALDSGDTVLIRVTNNPAYQVDYTVIAQVALILPIA